MEVVFRIQQLADKSLATRTHAGKVCRFLEPCFAIAPDGLWRGEGKCAPVQRYLSALAGKIESTRRELYDKIPSATRLEADTGVFPTPVVTFLSITLPAKMARALGR